MTTDIKFTDFPSVVTPTTSDLIWAVQSGSDVKETLGQVLSLALSTNSLSFAGNPNGNLAGTIYQTCYDTTNAKYYICTTTGSAATAVWTLVGANIVGLNQGGTAKALTASNGGIVYSDADSMEILSGTATANQIVLSGSSSAPSWSTATYPATTTINRILYSSAANTIDQITSANSAQLVTNATGVPAMTASLTDGQIVIGSTGATPIPATITGVGITVTNGAGSITLTASGGGMAWSTIVGTSQAADIDSGYICSNAGVTTVTCPAIAPIGSKIQVEGLGAGGWQLSANTSQTIQLGSAVTSSGGTLTSAAATDNVLITCIESDTTWRVLTTNSAGLTPA